GGIENLITAGVGGIIVFIMLEYLRGDFPITTVIAIILTVLLGVIFYQVAVYAAKRSGKTLKNIQKTLLPVGSAVVALVISLVIASPLTKAISYAYYDISGSLLPDKIDMSDWRLVIFGLILMLTLRFSQNGLLYPVIQRLTRVGSLADTVAKRDAASAMAESEAN
ncbi:MAG: hypothetical protein GY796_23525, partial [Chloroflexi bacterium]|nr:hypothetical protein [Chloroflexota bacterium]